jgi:hypothetical protein
MPQPATDLVKDIIIRFNRFTVLSHVFEPDLQGSDAQLSVSLSYSRLRFNLDKLRVPYFQYTIQQETPNALTAECYYHDQQKIDMLKTHFAPLATGTMEMSSGDTSGTVLYSETVASYLVMADSIARCAYLCTAGDDYRPGYFSEITVNAEGITLQQINHMNSRSLDHKSNYSLRDLEFFIPLKQSSVEKPLAIMEDHIGIMRIAFSDRSSQNNSMCGDRIQEKIDEEKLLFSKTHA